MSKTPSQVATVDPKRATSSQAPGSHICLTIACHPDSRRVGERLVLFGPGRREPVAVSRLAPGFSRADEAAPQALASFNLSRRPIWFSPEGDAAILIAPEENGTEVVADGVAMHAPRVFEADELAAGVVLELARRVVLLAHSEVVFTSDPPDLGFVGASDRLRHVCCEIAEVAPLSTPVLLLGETGVGKEIAARALHTASARAKGPFVAVNMAAVPAPMAASALFGHAEGSFTGAVRDHRGHFQAADGGTLFLDEVGATPPSVQAVLLRTLETGEVRPVGASGNAHVDVRVVAATDEDLAAAINAGEFRAPLYHRLAGYTITVPPLRERRADIGPLLFHFLREELSAVGAAPRLDPRAADERPWLPTELVSKLVRHSWPGNVRQLRNVVRQLVVGHHRSQQVDGARVSALLEAATTTQTPSATPPAPDVSAPAKTKPRARRSAEISEDELMHSLRAHRFRVGTTAEDLGITRRALYGLIEKSACVRKAKDLAREEILVCRDQDGGDMVAMAERLEVSERGLKLRMRDLGID